MSLMEILFRFVTGGLIVSTFAVLGDLCKPKSFAGLFGGAPSVALATLSLAAATKGTEYTEAEARAMAVGSVAFVFYAWCLSRVAARFEIPIWVATALLIPGWVIVALGLRAIIY